MSELWNAVDKIIEIDARITRMHRLREMVADARNATARRCGNCDKWMKSRICPKEKNVNGYSRGPSMNAPACDEFVLSAASQRVQKSKIAEAIEYAKEHNLPIPQAQPA